MVGEKYSNSENNKTYIMVEGFKRITKDWNCDRDIYTLEVCYLRDVKENHPSYNIAVTREQLRSEYKYIG